MSVRVMADVWSHSTATGTTLLVQLALADHAEDDKRSCFPSIGHVARKCRVSESTARRHIHELEKLGEVRVELNAGGSRKVHDSQRPNRYIIRDYPTPPVNLTPGVIDDTPPPVTDDTTPLSTVTPEPSVNRQGNQQTGRYAELVAVIAHKRSREDWVDDQEKVENATKRGLRQGQDCDALKACLLRHPMRDLAELADLYLDNAIPDAKKYRPRWE
jgi:hypothetical protein